MNRPIEFLTPRLVGKRFDDHSIPLEILKDLAALEELVTETAKWLYIKEHPGRERVPRGFTDGISIKLTDIDEGSAIPKLVLVISAVAGMTLFPPVNQEYFEKARENIINAVDAAERQGSDIATYLPDYLLGYFDRLGRSLQDDENIEFRPSNPARPARLNKATRKTLILASSKVQEYTEEVIIKGFIPEADQGKKTFTIALPDGQRIAAPLDTIFRDDVLKAFNSYQEQQKINIKGVGRYDRHASLLRIESIEDFNFIDKLDIGERLQELAKLEDGWLDGKGKAPDRESLLWIEKVFEDNYASSLPLPYLYPTAEGGIQAEWTLNDWEISLEISLNDKHGEFQAVNVKDGQEKNAEHDLTKPESWELINKEITSIAGVTA